MNREIALQWVDALKSGKYQQGTGTLRAQHDDKYCCLGVLCEISELGTWDREGWEWVWAYKVGEEDENAAVLPAAVQEWAEMKSKAGDLSDETNLARQNDSGKTFSEIAEIIERHWEDL